MKKSFEKAFLVYVWQSVFFTVGFYAWMVVDDYPLIIKHGFSGVIMGLLIWTIYYLLYYFSLSCYYWGIGSLSILIYHKYFAPNISPSR